MSDRDTLIAVQSKLADAQFLIAQQLGTVPPKVDPPVIPPVTPPVKPVGNVIMLDLPSQSAMDLFQAVVGQVYSMKLPKIPAGQTRVTSNPGTPNSMTVDMAYSQTPGDFDWPRSAVAIYRYPAPLNGQAFTPGYTEGNAESANLHWGTLAGQNTCKIDAVNQDWYMNIRIGNASGPLRYGYTPN